METLQLLGAALGLATLAGINLYLTVFLTGLAIRLGWIALAPQYEKLAILADPAILTVAGILFAIEFFADKVPWIDSAWDSVHTVIRPVGGALLSLQLLGTSSPVYDVIVALLGGGITLGAHTLKAGTRLLVNTSPEPFSNIALSLTEDAAVAGGVALTLLNPAAMFFVVAALVTLVLWTAPKLLRFFIIRIRFVWNKMAAPAAQSVPPLPSELPSRPAIRLAEAFSKQRLTPAPVLWALPCFAERLPRLRKNTEGWLAALDSPRHPLVFIPKSRSTPPVFPGIAGFTAVQESSFLAERLVLYHPHTKTRHIFTAFRWQASQVAAALRRIRQLLQPAPAPSSSATDAATAGAPASAPDTPAISPCPERIV